MTLTRPLSREELIEAARDQFALLMTSPRSTPQNVEAMKQIIAALENYPLARTAEASVRIIVADLMQRKGFAELILGISDWSATEKHLVELLKREVAQPRMALAEAQSGPAPETIDI